MKEWEGTEAEHLDDSGFEVEIEGEPDELSFDDEKDLHHKIARRGRTSASERLEEMKRLYDVAKAAKVGTEVVCPVCKTKHIKTTYHKVFCSNGRKTSKDCKSKYWNTIHPERLDRLY